MWNRRPLLSGEGGGIGITASPRVYYREGLGRKRNERVGSGGCSVVLGGGGQDRRERGKEKLQRAGHFGWSFLGGCRSDLSAGKEKGKGG